MFNFDALGAGLGVSVFADGNTTAMASATSRAEMLPLNAWGAMTTFMAAVIIYQAPPRSVGGGRTLVTSNVSSIVGADTQVGPSPRANT